MTQGNTVDPPNTNAVTVELQVGDVVDGRYGITSRLGRGGMGTVYEAQQIKLQRAVALKVLRPEFASRELAVKRFEREAKTASSIDHRNVVKILDFGQLDTGELYYTMELLQGRDLSQVLRDEGPLPWARAGWILLQVVRAFAAIHDKGIVHRDIKPANCFLLDPKPGDEPDLVKILDFGIANLQDQEKATALTGASDIIGSVRYMAPEQASADHVDARTDIYSLGIMMYELLTGVVPFRESNVFKVMLQHQHEAPVPPRQLVPEIPPGVEAIIMRAIAKQPDARFQSMREVETELLFDVEVVPGSGVMRGAADGSAAGRSLASATASPTTPSVTSGTGMPTKPLVETTPRIGASSLGIAPPPRPAKRKDHKALVLVGVALLLLVLVGGLGTTLWLERTKQADGVAKTDVPEGDEAPPKPQVPSDAGAEPDDAPLALAPPPEAPYDPFADPFGAPPLRGRGVPRAALGGAGDGAADGAADGGEAPSDAPEALVPLEEILPPAPWTHTPGSLAGRLHGADGRGLAKGRVCAWLVDPRAPAELRRRPRCAEADRQGRFVVRDVVPGLYDLGAFAQGFLPQSLLATQGYPLVLQPQEERTGIELVLTKGGTELRGTVRSSVGEPIASASVAVLGTARALAVTDASGAFSLWVAEGDVGVVAWASGYTDVVTRSRASEPLALVLQREAILFGKVVDAQTREPVYMARVRAGTQGGGVDPLVYTDDKGEFRIPALAAGTYEPTARTEGAYGRAAKPVKLLEGTISAEVVIEAQQTQPAPTEPAPEPEVVVLPPDAGGSTGGDDTGADASTGGGEEAAVPDEGAAPEPASEPAPAPEAKAAPKPAPTDRSLRKALVGKLRRCGKPGTGKIEIKAKYVLDTGKLFQPEVRVTGEAGKDPAVARCAEGHARQLKLLRRSEPSSFDPLVVEL